MPSKQKILAALVEQERRAHATPKLSKYLVDRCRAHSLDFRDHDDRVVPDLQLWKRTNLCDHGIEHFVNALHRTPLRSRARFKRGIRARSTKVGENLWSMSVTYHPLRQLRHNAFKGIPEALVGLTRERRPQAAVVTLFHAPSTNSRKQSRSRPLWRRTYTQSRRTTVGLSDCPVKGTVHRIHSR